MKRTVIIFLLLFGMLASLAYAADSKPKIILLIAEQNIEGPQRADANL